MLLIYLSTGASQVWKYLVPPVLSLLVILQNQIELVFSFLPFSLPFFLLICYSFVHFPASKIVLLLSPLLFTDLCLFKSTFTIVQQGVGEGTRSDCMCSVCHNCKSNHLFFQQKLVRGMPETGARFQDTLGSMEDSIQ